MSLYKEEYEYQERDTEESEKRQTAMSQGERPRTNHSLTILRRNQAYQQHLDLGHSASKTDAISGALLCQSQQTNTGEIQSFKLEVHVHEH